MMRLDALILRDFIPLNTATAQDSLGTPWHRHTSVAITRQLSTITEQPKLPILMTTKLRNFSNFLKTYNFTSFRMASNRHTVDLTGDDEPEQERPRKRSRTAGFSLRDSISPPPARNNQSPANSSKKRNENSNSIAPGSIIPSPFQLTTIRDLPEALNRDTVSLQSLICDPMIAEMWEFNYMHDLDFLMNNLDPDTRDTTRVNVVHGYWKADSGLGMKVCTTSFSTPQTYDYHIIDFRILTCFRAKHRSILI